jgi:uncharacterized protein (TIGR03084 family)
VDEIVTALAEQHAELDALLATMEEPDWQRPSRCEGWTVADVVLHLAQTDELAVASLAGQLTEAAADLAGWSGAATVDDGAARSVASQRGTSGAEIRRRWRAGAESLVAALQQCDPHRRVMWVAGRLSAQTLATTRLAETWIHTGDVAATFGLGSAASDGLRHIARLAWRTLPYAFARAGRRLTGPVVFDLRGPGGDRWTFTPEGDAVTVISGDALDLCLVAARRIEPGAAGLHGDGPDADAVLELVRTYA